MTEELEVLRIITGRLESAGIGYMVTGSIAMNYYAVPRMTRDIDVVVELEGADADRVCALFEGDFYVDRDAVRAAIAERGVFNLIHQAHVIKVDFIVRKESDVPPRRVRSPAAHLRGGPRVLHRRARGSDHLQARLGEGHALGGPARRCPQPADVCSWSGHGVPGAVDRASWPRRPVSRGKQMRDTRPEIEQSTERCCSPVPARSA